MAGVKTAGKILAGTITIVVILFLIILIVIWFNSSGKLEPITDINDQEIATGISEKVYHDINGLQQGMFLRGEDASKPVLLFLHGGPGSPELAIGYGIEDKNARLEQEFVVCYWDQRGAGMSYSKDINISTMTPEQLVEDTKEVTSYLKERFNQEKIYLLGHSWGSYLGIKTIEKYPELYHAFMGVGQVSDQTESEKLAYEYMLKEATQRNDKSAIKALEKFDVNAADFPQQKYTMGTRTNLMNKYGIGTTHEKSSMGAMIIDLLMFSGYTVGDKIGYMRGILFSLENVFPYVLDDSLFESSTKFEVPVYIFHGDYDYQVSQELAREYCGVIEAPDKQYYAFTNSAHSPLWEEPAKFMEDVRDVLRRVEEGF